MRKVASAPANRRRACYRLRGGGISRRALHRCQGRSHPQRVAGDDERGWREKFLHHGLHRVLSAPKSKGKWPPLDARFSGATD